MERVKKYFPTFKIIVAGLLFLLSALALVPIVLLTSLSDCPECTTNAQALADGLPLLCTIAVLGISGAYLIWRSVWLWRLCATIAIIIVLSPLIFLLYYAWGPS